VNGDRQRLRYRHGWYANYKVDSLLAVPVLEYRMLKVVTIVTIFTRPTLR